MLDWGFPYLIQLDPAYADIIKAAIAIKVALHLITVSFIDAVRLKKCSNLLVVFLSLPSALQREVYIV